MHQRQRPQSADPLIRRRRRRRRRRPHPDLQLARSLQDRIRVRRRHHLAEAHAEGQQVAHGDRPVCGHGVLKRPIETLQDLAVGQFRQQPIHRLVQPNLTFLHEDHRRRGRDRLGHRADADDRVAPHRVAAADRLHADRIDMHLAPPADQRDDTGHFAALHIAGHDVMHAAEPRLGQFTVAHLLSLSVA